ncbi:MAG: prolyl oligopeptidase family serine peptidase [Terracidiphilus sp.]
MNLRLLQRSPRLLALLLVFAPIVFVASVTRLHGQTAPGSFTLQQVLSAPFTSDLIAAPAKKRIAWVANIEGRNNLWVAEPGSQGFAARQLTHYTDDDGVGVNTPRWTADAGTIVYELGGSDEDEAKPTPNPAWLVKGVTQQIWIAPLAGGEPRLIGEGHLPAVSPDGKTVAFVRDKEIWTAPLDAVDTKPGQLLVTRGSASDLRWSPDGKKLAFKSDRDDHSFIAVFDFDKHAVVYLDPSSDHDQGPSWSPDSKTVAFVRVPSEADQLDFVEHRTAQPWSIRVADAETGEGHAIFNAAEGQGSAFQPTESDAQLMWVAGSRIVFPWEKDGWLHLYSVAASGGESALLTPGDFEVDRATVSPKGDAIVFDSNQYGADKADVDRRHIWRIGFAAGVAATAPQQLTSGQGIETQPVVASDGETIAVLRSDAKLPMRAALVNAGGLTDLAPQAIPADFPASKLVTPQQVIFTASDGMTIHGQLFVPPNAKPGERLPALVFFHGGSRRQMLLGFSYMGYYSNAYAMNQYLASRGYIVLSVNYRSGIGYGLNFREALNYGAGGASEFNDVMGAGLYLKSRSDVDPTRIGCWGGSYGGYLTALALSRASSLFAAGVDFHGVHDWNLEMPVFVPHYDPAKHAEVARMAYESSPISSVSTWRSPVLLIHGDDDRNVPFAETVQLVEALRKQKVDFEELIFPDEIHGFLLHRDWLRAYAAETDFFDRKLKATPR